MKKITRKIMAAVSAAVMCAVPMASSFSANAAVNQSKTYLVIGIGQNPNIAFFDFTLNYDSSVNANPGTATYLCKNGYFSSSNNTSQRKVLHTYNGAAIGAKGDLFTTKFVAPMNSDSIFDYVSQSDVKIRNASGTTLSPSSITLDSILLGDVDMNGVVNDDDATLIMQSIGNPDRYPLTYRQVLAGDVYESGSGLTGQDALTIQRYVLGQIEHF